MKMTDKMFEPLDDYEREIMEAVENDEYEPKPISKKEMKWIKFGEVV